MGAVCYDAEPMTGYVGEIGKSRNFDTSICYNKYIGGFGMNVLIVEDDEAIANPVSYTHLTLPTSVFV